MDFVTLQKWIPNLLHPLVIAGPCSAESEEQVLDIARQVAKDPRVKLFRAGIWKPRTRPGSFEGVGEVGLKWMQKVKEETGLLLTTEVANAKHVEMCLKHDIDVLWIGARTTASPFAVQEIADALKGTQIPVMVKNPINEDLALWLGALERIAGTGNLRIAAIHRGFSSYEKNKYRNPPRWKIPMELKRRFPSLPIITDPSHIAGRRDLIFHVCQKAMDVDFDGLMVETHNNPDKALSDAAQQVTPEHLQNILSSLNYKTEFSTNRHIEEELEMLRAQIDGMDKEILDQLEMRMKVVEQIAEAKCAGGITALQVNRMDALLKDRIEKGLRRGLREEYVAEIFNCIHEESVKRQTDLMSKLKMIKESDGKIQTIS